ncbi:MAG: hypothetical protein AAF740_11430, partial [Bacteroidota bacterium]
MAKLHPVVDSLHRTFESSTLDKRYFAKEQAKGHFVYITGDRADRAKKDIERGISFKRFIKKYPEARISRELLILKYQYRNHLGDDVIHFESAKADLASFIDFFTGDDGGCSMTFKQEEIHSKIAKNSWVTRRNIHDSEGIYIYSFFFTTELKTQPLLEP